MQWYKKNPDLFRAEVEAMYAFKPDAEYGYLEDGRFCWMLRFKPVVADKKCRTYDVALVYDKDHPVAKVHGSSVRAFLLSPTLQELRQIVNNSPRNPKWIPHVIVDDGEEYICTIHKDAVGNNNLKSGVITAATNARNLAKWITIFELGLMDQQTWDDFHKEGVF